MPLAQIEVKLDLDGDGTFETDISSDVRVEAGVDVQGAGREREGDEGGQLTANVHVNNITGKYTFGGPAVLSGLRPWRRGQVKVAYNAVTYTRFTGYLMQIQPSTNVEHDAFLTFVDESAYLGDRAQVRLPLMPNQRTGVIIHRLLDYAESGEDEDFELLANPRFRDDLTDWSDTASATLTRETDGELVHAPACGQVVVTATAADRGAVTEPENLSDVLGKPITIIAYPYAIDGAGDGKPIEVAIVETGGASPGTTETAGTLSSDPVPVIVQRTIDAGATAVDVYVRVPSSNSDAFTYRVGAAHLVLTGRYRPRVIDLGEEKLANISFPLGAALLYIQQVRDNELGGLFYLRGDGAAVFEGRLHRFLGDHLTSQATFTESMDELRPIVDAAFRVSKVVLTHASWEIGAAGTEVFSLAPVPEPLPPGETLIDVDFEGGLVRDAIKPVVNTDITINAAADGAGPDRSSDVTIAFESFGGTAVLKLNNTSSDLLYLTRLKIRATPIRPSSDRRRKKATPTALIDVAVVLRHTYDLNTNPAAVQAWANYLAQRFGDDQIVLFEMILKSAFPVADLSGHLVQMLAREISDRITITQDDLPWSAQVTAKSFYIDTADLVLDEREAISTWRLSPIWPDAATAPNMAIVGTTDVGDPDPIGP